MITPPSPLSAAAASADDPPPRARDRPWRKDRPRRDAAREETQPGSSPSCAPVPDLRLVVEADAEGQPVYLWIDRLSGAVARRLARADLETLGRDPAYVAGGWVDTRA